MKKKLFIVIAAVIFLIIGIIGVKFVMQSYDYADKKITEQNQVTLQEHPDSDSGNNTAMRIDPTGNWWTQKKYFYKILKTTKNSKVFIGYGSPLYSGYPYTIGCTDSRTAEAMISADFNASAEAMITADFNASMEVISASIGVPLNKSNTISSTELLKNTDEKQYGRIFIYSKYNVYQIRETAYEYDYYFFGGVKKTTYLGEKIGYLYNPIPNTGEVIAKWSDKPL